VDLRAAFCHSCGVIQPALPMDHFSRLGLPRNYDLKEDDLERQYFGFQRSFHPDRFASKSPREQAISMEYAANINDAYDTLRDPLQRAEYLLLLEGRPVSGSDGSTVSDPELLMEVMELSELIVGADTLDQTMPLLERANAEVAASEIALGVVFADNDLDRAANIALRLRYMTRLAGEARQNVVKLRGSEGN
jgi:molecular chaperone HscB